MKFLKILVLLVTLVSFAVSANALDVAPLDTCYQWFPDVSSDHLLCKAIEKFAELGITTGYPDGYFRPGNSVTRGQMAAFILRALELLSNNDGANLSLDKLTLPQANTGIYYSQTVTMTAAGITSPQYNCLITSGVAGISASVVGNVCTIQGTPTSTGEVIVKFTASNSSVSDQRLRVFSITAPMPLSLNNPNPDPLPNGALNQYYYTPVAMSATGGTQPYAFNCSGSVPGVSISPSGSTCNISGTPTALGTYPVAFSVTDSANPADLDQQIRNLTITSCADPQHVHLAYNTAYDDYIIPAGGTQFFEATLSSPCTTTAKELRFSLTMLDQANLDMLVKKSNDMSLCWPTLSDYNAKLTQTGYDNPNAPFTDGTYFWNFIGSLGGETVIVEQTYTQYPGFYQDDTYYILVHNTDSVNRTVYIRYYCF
jgi:hypothetical protein